jgi:hypothetical protein
MHNNCAVHHARINNRCHGLGAGGHRVGVFFLRHVARWLRSAGFSQNSSSHAHCTIVLRLLPASLVYCVFSKHKPLIAYPFVVSFSAYACLTISIGEQDKQNKLNHFTLKQIQSALITCSVLSSITPSQGNAHIKYKESRHTRCKKSNKK